MSLVDKILDSLLEASLSYNEPGVRLFNFPKYKNYSRNSLKSTLTRLRSKGFIENSDKGWRITPTGKKYIKKKADSFVNFESCFLKDAPKNLIVMFDIPETQKAEREWFRWHLKKFSYKMIQKSVWVGPSPLPKKFNDYVKQIGLKEVPVYYQTLPANARRSSGSHGRRR